VKLYIGNMPFSMGEEELRSLFSQHGDVTSANVIVDRGTGRSRGFGFVEMEDDDARKAMSALNEHEVDGRKLIVNEAKPRRDRDSRGGGGGGHRNRY
jgi:cold-inducible RNA-binding protein